MLLAMIHAVLTDSVPEYQKKQIATVTYSAWILETAVQTLKKSVQVYCTKLYDIFASLPIPPYIRKFMSYNMKSFDYVKICICTYY